jgi:hypothetical protein
LRRKNLLLKFHQVFRNLPPNGFKVLNPLAQSVNGEQDIFIVYHHDEHHFITFQSPFATGYSLFAAVSVRG